MRMVEEPQTAAEKCNELCMIHGEQLEHDAEEMLEDHPGVSPFAILYALEAAQGDREDAERLLRGEAISIYQLPSYSNSSDVSCVC